MAASATAAAASAEVTKYAHSPVHRAVLTRDYSALRRIISSLPRLSDPSTIYTESDSLAEESKADSISAILDRRDVPSRETPLHLAVRLSDPISVDLLLSAGADWSLQNEHGWSALQEAICRREENLARIIVRHYQPLAWAKWCRRLPRLVAVMRRMRDFYLEISFHFDSSVIPFVSRVAPSDTYKIWKRGANLRADLSLAGFDGLRIHRADQSILFLGDGILNDPRVKSGALLMLMHKDREVVNALHGAGAPASEAEVAQEVAAMSQSSIFRPGIDVTQAVLLPQVNWRRQEKTEMVGPWKAKVYDMHNVVVSVKSRRVPGTVVSIDEDDLFSSCSDNVNDSESSVVDEFEDILTEDERRQLEAALRMENDDESGTSDGLVGHRHSCYEPKEIPVEDGSGNGSSNNSLESSKQQDKKGWFGGWGKRGQNKDTAKKMPQPRSSLCVDEKVSDLLGESPPRYQSRPGRHSVEISGRSEDLRRLREKDLRKAGSLTENGRRHKEGGKESEYKKGLRPTLWLSSDFPLQTDELLPLLDILASKVKAIRRFRELLTTKLPAGTFPVKVAIPVVPTIRVLVTFTKFEELQPLEEFSTPPSSPGSKSLVPSQASSSWFQWVKVPYRQSSTISGPSSRVEDIQDPFIIPPDYTWTTPEAKKKKMQENKGKSRRDRAPGQ